MADCEFCGCLRLSGRPIERTGDGWRDNIGALNPMREDLKFACRDCAKEKVNA